MSMRESQKNKRSVGKCIGMTLGRSAETRVNHIQDLNVIPKGKNYLRRSMFQRNIFCHQDLLKTFFD